MFLYHRSFLNLSHQLIFLYCTSSELKNDELIRKVMREVQTNEQTLFNHILSDNEHFKIFQSNKFQNCENNAGKFGLSQS